MAEADRAKDATSFRVFRGADAPDLNETDKMTLAGLTPIVEAGIGRWVEAGVGEGNITKVLFSLPHMSLTYAWFKSGFALPLHSHNADCLYYIIAGSLKLGTEELAAGDGFFVGSDVPYTLQAWPRWRRGARIPDGRKLRHEISGPDRSLLGQGRCRDGCRAA